MSNIKIYVANNIQTSLIALIKQLYTQDITICINCAATHVMQESSKLLWNNRTFLPHAIDGDSPSTNFTFKEWYIRQPIFLTCTYNQARQSDPVTNTYTESHIDDQQHDDNPNNAQAYIYLDHIPEQSTDVTKIHKKPQYIIFFLAKSNPQLEYIRNQLASRYTAYKFYNV